MKTQRIILAGLMLLACLIPNVSFAQGEAGVLFLLISPTPRPGALGESGGGIADDASAMYYNPAGLAFQKGSEISLTHSNWLPQLGLSDIFYENLNFKTEVPAIDGTIGANIIYMNYGTITRTNSTSPDPIGEFRSFEVAGAVAYATQATDEIGIGAVARFIYSKLADFGTEEEKGKGVGSSVSFDISMLYKPKVLVIPFIGDVGNAFSVGFNLSNMGPKITYIDAAQASPLPTNLRLGFGYKILDEEHNALTYSLDFSRLLVRRYDNDVSDPFYKAIFTAWGDGGLRRVTIGTGLEYWYDKTVALRVGYFHEDPNYGGRKFMTFGGGIRYDIYGFDFSYLSASESSPLANTLRFSVLLNW